MKYTVQIEFNTDRVLTDNELDTLLTAITVQIEEPADEIGNDAEFTTNSITVKAAN
jgi:hypothetical protein